MHSSPVDWQYGPLLTKKIVMVHIGQTIPYYRCPSYYKFECSEVVLKIPFQHSNHSQSLEIFIGASKFLKDRFFPFSQEYIIIESTLLKWTLIITVIIVNFYCRLVLAPIIHKALLQLFISG